jgi:predicted dehydrogenase
MAGSDKLPVVSNGNELSRRRFVRGLAGGAGAAAAAGLLAPGRRAFGWGGAPSAPPAAPPVAAPPVPALAPGERPIGYALVGLGKLALKQLVPALGATRACRLTALVSGHPDKARRVAAENGVPEKNIYTYETFDRIADNPDVDVVYVVLPNAMHAEYTIRAARAGKHVYCEKPMAVSSAECEQMIAACRKANRRLGVGYRLHFEPYNLELVRLARSRELGAVKFIAATAGTIPVEPGQWRLDKKLSGGGSLVDIGIYALQAARYVAGEEPVAVSARQTITDPVKFKGIDETLAFTMTFGSGVVASCVSTYAAHVSRVDVATDGGQFGLEPALYYHGIKGFRSDGRPFSFPDVDQFAAEMDDFALAVRRGTPTRVPGEEGLRDVRIIEALYSAAATGREVRLAAGG